MAMRDRLKPPLHVAAALLFAAVAAAQCAAQQTPPVRTSNDAARIREMMERAEQDREAEFALHMLENLRLPEERAETRRQPVALIREDYVRLQVVNNELAEVTARPALDLKLVTAAAGEIKKRAERLKLNLSLPEADEDAKRPKSVVGADAAQLKAALKTLDELILRFVRNPVFTSPRTVNVQHSATAQRELDEIIRLSGQVKKSSEQLTKNAQQSP